MFKLGATFWRSFLTQTAATPPVQQDADSLPTAALRRNGTNDGAVTLTVHHNGTGDYSVTGVIPLTYVLGDTIEVIVSGTVSSVPGELVIPLGQVGPDFDLTITPLQASASNPFYAVGDLSPLAQGSAPQTAWTVVDGNKNPIDLSAKTVRLVVYSQSLPLGACDPFDAALKPLYQYQTGGAGITIGGTGNNVVTVQHTAANLATAGHFYYWLLNVTDLLPLAWGKLPVRPAVWSV